MLELQLEICTYCYYDVIFQNPVLKPDVIASTFMQVLNVIV